MSRRPRRLFGPRPRQGSVTIGVAWVFFIVGMVLLWLAGLFINEPHQRAYERPAVNSPSK